MYAVIATGGKQYRVAEGTTVKVEKLDVAEGDSIKFDEVLLVADGDNVNVGTPHVAGSTVTATVKSHGRGKKIHVIKFKRRKNYRRKIGHRQSYTELEITGITC